MRRRSFLMLSSTAVAATCTACGKAAAPQTSGTPAAASPDTVAPTPQASAPAVLPTQVPDELPGQFSIADNVGAMAGSSLSTHRDLRLVSHYLAAQENQTLWYADVKEPNAASGLFYLTSEGGREITFKHADSLGQVPDQLELKAPVLPLAGASPMVIDHAGAYGYTLTGVPFFAQSSGPPLPLSIAKVELATGQVVKQIAGEYPAASGAYGQWWLGLSGDGERLVAAAVDFAVTWRTADLTAHEPGTMPKPQGAVVAATGDHLLLAPGGLPDGSHSVELQVQAVSDGAVVAQAAGATWLLALGFLYTYQPEAQTWTVTNLVTGQPVQLADALPTGVQPKLALTNGYVLVSTETGFQVREPGSPHALVDWSAAQGQTVPESANAYGRYLFTLDPGGQGFEVHDMQTGEKLPPAGGGLSYVERGAGGLNQGLADLRDLNKYGAVYAGRFYQAIGWVGPHQVD